MVIGKEDGQIVGSHRANVPASVDAPRTRAPDRPSAGIVPPSRLINPAAFTGKLEWDERQKMIVQAGFDSWEDQKLRNWMIAGNANFLRTLDNAHGQFAWGEKPRPVVGGKTFIWGNATGKPIHGSQPSEKKFVGIPPDKGIAADGGALKFKDHFFSHSPAKRESLLAFEAGKVFWNIMKDKTVEDGQTLEQWFRHQWSGRETVIAEMKRARHKGEGLSDPRDIKRTIADPEMNSQFACVFRAQALGLRNSKDSDEWEEVIEEFRENVHPLLRSSRR
ncbi:MAG: hypothetical protein HY913_04285 [Desulfomonile tiedjei]|nr:hypothetical protein [Desulfomonile tiedjei]